MKLKYDKKVDALYINFEQKKQKVLHTLKLKDFLLVDIGKKGKVNGIEILNASEHLPAKFPLQNRKRPAKTKK